MNITTKRLILLLCFHLGLLAGCSIDFDEAIPCDSDQHCPADMFCQMTDHRCELGSRSQDTADLSGDTGTDVIVQDPQTDTSDGDGSEPDSPGDAEGTGDSAE